LAFIPTPKNLGLNPVIEWPQSSYEQTGKYRGSEKPDRVPKVKII